MPTKRNRLLDIEVTEFHDSPVDPNRLEIAVWEWNSALIDPTWKRVEDDNGNADLILRAEGGFSTREAEQLAARLRDAMDNRGHAIMFLSEDYTDGPKCICELKLLTLRLRLTQILTIENLSL